MLFYTRVATFAQRQRTVILSTIGLFALFGAFAFTSTHASEPWQWRDLSQNIPSTVQNALTLGASRGTDWLTSDGTRLWSINTNEEVASYTDEARTRGSVQHIGADADQYLIAFANGSGVQLTKTDLRTWQDISDLRFSQKRVRSIKGSGGTWGIITEDQFANGDLPRTWQLNLWDGTKLTANLPLPSDVSAFSPGCKESSSGGSICAGNVAFVPVNGQWYLFAGSAETHDANGLA
ncbi:hypothetical protein KBB27_04165, partial [Patescibacteria group bacterium]|nr:hypothetical protein [Patescibacteria group bacterium]